MKRIVSAAAIALALSVSSGFAADLPSRKQEPPYAPPPPPLWTGFYVGANVGGGWASNGGSDSYVAYADPKFPLLSVPAGSATPNLFLLSGGGALGDNNGGIIGGGQIGYNYQFGANFVFGGEADIQGTGITYGNLGNFALAYPTPYLNGSALLPLSIANGGNAGLPWFGTLRGRAGWLATPSLLLYGAAGFAFGEATAFNVSNTRTGWTAGGGVEWLFKPNWSLKLEYLYVDLDSSGTTGGGGWTYGYHYHPQINFVRAGVNYHLNWGAPAPVVAKY